MTTEDIAISVVSAERRAFRRRPLVRQVAVDVAILMIAALDVWLVFPDEYETYSLVFSFASCAALLLRRWFPFATLLIAVPGFFAGWAQLAAMLALGYLAARLQSHWKMWVGAGLVWLCRFFLWPPAEFVALTWREHVLDAIYGVIVAGMPVAIGLLIGARTELSARLTELAASRDRERQLHAQAVRAEERARLAREMHDVVSHDVTLIAMQANTLSTAGDDAPEIARTIRKLSTRTLEELRALVGVLRTGADADATAPDLADLHRLVRDAGMPVQVTVELGSRKDLPPTVSAAAYRMVQECLTNVRKHAPGASARVRITGDDNDLAVEVRNEPPRQQVTKLPSGGYGLTGLAERTRLLGGTFESGPTPDGGFRAVATYPAPSTLVSAETSSNDD